MINVNLKRWALTIFDLDMKIQIKYRGHPDGPIRTKQITAREMLGSRDHDGWIIEARPDSGDALIVREIDGSMR